MRDTRVALGTLNLVQTGPTKQHQLGRALGYQHQRRSEKPHGGEVILMREKDVVKRYITCIEYIYDLPNGAILSFARTQPVSDLRKAAMRLAREGTSLTYSEIGEVFDREPNTVWRAVNA